MSDSNGEHIAGMSAQTELELYRRIFFASSDYISFSRLSDGTYVDVNPGFERMMGFSRAEVVGRTSFEIGIWPDDEKEQRAAYATQLRRDRMVKDYPGRLRTASGRIILVEASANIIEVAGEQILVAIVRDVTERKHAEQELRETDRAVRQLADTLEQRVRERTIQLQDSEARMRSVFQSSYQHMGFLAPDGTLLDTNRIALDSIHSTLEQVAGKPYWQTPWFSATPGMPQRIQSAVGEAAAGRIVRQEIALELPDGPRTFDFSLRPVTDVAGKVLAIVPEAVDITERRLVEDALRQSQKMEAVGQLTGGIAHDFNNLLAGILGNLQLMRMRVSQGRGDTLIRYIDAAESVVDRATTLTQRLLAFSRRQTLDPQAIHVNQLVASMGELIRRTVGPAVELKTVLAADVWDTRCDPHQLESALLNLAINARDAMPKGGRLTIETSNTMLFKPALSVNGAAAEHGANGEYVTIAVTDNGSGMTPEVAARAFDPFFTTKPIGQGTGLGLSMVFGFIKQSEGHVGIQSDPDVGTTVRIHLPRQASTPHAPIKATATRPTIAPVQNATVLVVDDELALRSVLLDALRGAGYTTLEAGDAPTALAMLRARPELDMLVTDVGLPGHLNGRQLAEAAIALRPGLRMLFITGYADVELTKAGMPEGAAILHKPFSIDAFVGKVAELMSPIHHRAGLPES